MFVSLPDQNGLTIHIAVAHIVALVPQREATQVITTGMAGDQPYDVFVALEAEEVLRLVKVASGLVN